MHTQEIRRRNLRALFETWGGPTALARRLGHANGSYLTQLAGPNPTRQVSEKVAREIELQLALPVGWLDQEAPGSATLGESELNECVHACVSAINKHDLHPDAATYTTLISLVYDYRRLAGKVDDAVLGKLVSLLKR